MRDFIERLRSHPVHIRQRIALGATFGVTGLVALIWITTLATSGTLALNLNSPTDNSADSGLAASPTTVHGAVTETKSSFSQLLGALGALNESRKPALSPVGATSTPVVQPANTSQNAGTNMNSTSQTSVQF